MCVMSIYVLKGSSEIVNGKGILGDSQFLKLKRYFEDLGKSKGLAMANCIL